MPVSQVSLTRPIETPAFRRFHFDPAEEQNVLIVDASRLIRSVFFSTLSPRYNCTTAASFNEALHLLKVFPFDVVIADSMLPGLPSIVEAHPEATIILTSAVDRPPTAPDAVGIEAFDRLTKPCGLDVLDLAVERAFKHRTLLKNAALTEETGMMHIAERVNTTARNGRTFSQVAEAGFKKNDINDGLDSAIRRLPQYFSTGNIALIRDYGDSPAIDASGPQIDQVWMNLLVNAAQAIGTGRGHVRITTRADNEFVTITVADSGTGRTRQDLSRILDTASTAHPLGTGSDTLLSTCFRIVEGHGGTILAASQLKVGTAFTVRLPIKMKHQGAIRQTGLALYDTPFPTHEQSSYDRQPACCR